MNIFNSIGRMLVRDFDRPDDQVVRARHGYAAGWTSIVILILLFFVRLWLGLAAEAVSVVAVSFTLLSDLMASLVLVVSFWISGRPATSRNPFGHGRMEQVAPLLISFVLFFLAVEIGRESAHTLATGHEAAYWTALPWIILATAVVKMMLGRFVLFMGRRVSSGAIEETAAHLNIEGVYSLAVVVGLLAGHFFHLKWMDGTVGIAGAAAILYMSYRNARHALVPLLGEAPSEDLIKRAHAVSATVEGVSAVHEITVHSYGKMRVMSMHAEIPETYSPAEIHGIAEDLEETLRRELGGDVIVHADPLMEMTPEVAAVEEKLKTIINGIPSIKAYHDFRVVAHSRDKIIIIADLEVDRELSDEERSSALTALRQKAEEEFPNLAYPVFNLTSRFSF